MAITCEICGKKQSAWIQDFSLSSKLVRHRICANCHQEQEKLKKGSSDYSAFKSAKDYFDNVIDNIADEEVKNYLISEINTIESSANELKQKEDEENEKRERLNQEKAAMLLAKQQSVLNMLVTTGYQFEGYKIVKYMEIVSADTVLGTGAFSEFGAGLSDLFGVESNLFSEKVQQARQSTQKKLIIEAAEKGANAIIGVDFDYIVFGQNMIGVSVTGTAVIVEKTEETHM